jgi:hypothetical protein
MTLGLYFLLILLFSSSMRCSFPYFGGFEYWVSMLDECNLLLFLTMGKWNNMVFLCIIQIVNVVKNDYFWYEDIYMLVKWNYRFLWA